MSVRLAVPAVVAADARLNEARTIRRRQRVLIVARMSRQRDHPRGIGDRLTGRLHTGDHVANERAQRVFIHGRAHACTSTESTMPTIAASGEPTGKTLVALDSVGAGVGERVFFVRGREAAFPFYPAEPPTDASVIGIIDRVDLE